MASTLEAFLLAQVAALTLPISATPASSSSNGTPTASSTETEDTVLGTYQCSLIAGRRYLAVMNGLIGNCGTAGGIFLCNIRNSGSGSAPTASSTLVAQQQWTSTTTATASRVGIPLANSFIAPTSGLNTFAFFAQLVGGSGIFTPVSPTNGFRELYVMYLGVV